MKKTPATKRKPAPRNAKKPAKRKAITKEVLVEIDRHYHDRVLIAKSNGELEWNSMEACMNGATDYFDLRGMKPGDVRKFKITTEAID